MIALNESIGQKPVPPEWWQPIGEWAYRPFDRDERRLLFTTKSAHLIISKSGALKDAWIVRWRIFRKKSTGKKDIHRWRRFTGTELAIAFCVLRRDNGSTDRKFARRIKANFAVPGKFARKGRFLLIADPETGNREDNISILVRKPFTRAVDYFLRHGETGRL